MDWPVCQTLLEGTLLGVMGTGVSLVSSLISKDLVDIITGHETGRLISTFAAMIGFSIGNILVAQASGYASTLINLKVDTEIKNDIFAKMMVTDWESLTTYHTGDLVTRWSSDASNIASGILNWIPNLIIYTVRFISALAIVIYYDPTFAIFALLGIPFSALLSKPLLKRMSKNNQRSAQMNAKLYGFNQETFSNIQTIKAFNLIPLYVDYLKQLQKDYVKMRMDFQRMSMVTSFLMATMGLLVSYSSYGWGIYRVWDGVISYGTMTMFLSLSSTLTGTLNSLISLVPNAINLTTSAGRIMDILDMPREDFSHDKEVQAFKKESETAGIHISIDRLDYTYHNGTEVFCDASLQAAPHEIVALVGPSGEGKTTMLRLILALLTPGNGTITLWSELDTSRKTLSLSPSCRQLFSYVPQGNTMFSGTIAENMRHVKPDATDEEIKEALSIACAWDFVNAMKDGIHSVLMERGGGLSEGQAQRLSIARALMKKAELYIFDDSFSALDFKTDAALRKALAEETKDAAVLIIAQRIGTIRNADQIIVLEEGRIVGTGCHDDLMKTCPVYQDIAESQMKGDVVHE